MSTNRVQSISIFKLTIAASILILLKQYFSSLCSQTLCISQDAIIERMSSSILSDQIKVRLEGMKILCAGVQC